MGRKLLRRYRLAPTKPTAHSKTSVDVWPPRCTGTTGLAMRGSATDRISTGYIPIHPLDREVAVTAMDDVTERLQAEPSWSVFLRNANV